MKAHLLYPDRDFGPRSPPPWNAEALARDLDLDTLLAAMARDDKFVLDVCRTVVLGGVQGDIATIRHRQGILRDCLDHPAVVRELYALAVQATECEKKNYLGTMTRYPDWVLRWAVELMESLLDSLRKLRHLADTHAGRFAARGWAAFFSTVQRELDDGFLGQAEGHLRQMKFRDGVLLSAGLGTGNKAVAYALHRPSRRKRDWLAWLLTPRPPSFGFSLHPRDESGAQMLSEIRNRAIAIAAGALGQSAEHVRAFFGALRRELAFHIGCLNLHEQLARKGEPTCFPEAAPAGERLLSCRGLYDACLALRTAGCVVGNDADTDGKGLVIVTGANQGGKSTFLRSVGLAQLMMQSGMFVAAEAFRSSVCDGLFTHFRREEDAGMKSGKLDEELGRMSDIVDHLTPTSMVLFNESFAATNEREGSEVAGQIVSALLDRGVRMAFVTHLFEFPRGVYESNRDKALFLRADRARTFRLREGEPLPTSFGEDLYEGVFGKEDRQSVTAEAKTHAQVP